MTNDKVYLLIGGAQGSGIETTSYVLTAALARRGYGVLSNREYFSNIVGRHSYIQMAVSSKEIPRSHTFPVDFVGAIDAETVFTHYDDVREGGYLLYDKDTQNTRLIQIKSMEPELAERLKERFQEMGIEPKLASLIDYLANNVGVKVIGLSYRAVLDKLRQKYGLGLAQLQRYRSSIPIGVVAGLMDLDVDSVVYGLSKRFAGREKIVETNKFLVTEIMKEVKELYGSPLKLEKSKLNHDELLLVSGNDIVGMGKAVGGLRFQSYYPITPAADESLFLERYESLRANGESKGSMLIFQTEDEIAAITSAIGAALAGVRSSTTTSGPGFSLMAEGIGWAGMNEVPVVITIYQRGGPSTGLPTRGSQADMLFSIFAGHGEFAKIVISSGDHMEAFYDSIWAFNLAERYQTPVIHLLDKFLANSITTLPVPDFSPIKIDRGKIILEADKGPFKRFDTSETISPRPVIGSGAITWYTGDEHDEYGHITEDPVNRDIMYEKRTIKKLDLIDKEVPPEERAQLYGTTDADFLLVGWGMVKGPALDALRELEGEGIKGAYLSLRMLNPLPSEYVLGILEKFGQDNVIIAEHNVMAQAAKLIRMNTGFEIKKQVLKYNGRPIFKMELADAIKLLLEKKEGRVVLKYAK